jgi:hypothetical protein
VLVEGGTLKDFNEVLAIGIDLELAMYVVLHVEVECV